MLPALKPIMMRERISLIFIEYGQIDVVDGAFVVIDKNGVRTHIPVGSVACIMLERGWLYPYGQALVIRVRYCRCF